MKIIGTKSDDHLVGTDSDDIIKGRKGDDYLTANDGYDLLSGGPGRDTFWIDADGFDTILDFQPGKDRIIVRDENVSSIPGPHGGDDPPFEDITFSAPFLFYGENVIASLHNVYEVSESDLFVV